MEDEVRQLVGRKRAAYSNKRLQIATKGLFSRVVAKLLHASRRYFELDSNFPNRLNPSNISPS